MTTSDPTPDGDPSLQALPAARPASGSGGPASLVALRPPTDPPPLGEWAADSRERKHTVGVLAVALGFLGVHKFLLGYRFAGTRRPSPFTRHLWRHRLGHRTHRWGPPPQDERRGVSSGPHRRPAKLVLETRKQCGERSRIEHGPLTGSHRLSSALIGSCRGPWLPARLTTRL
jgi:hypothetical protein